MMVYLTKTLIEKIKLKGFNIDFYALSRKKAHTLCVLNLFP